MGRASLFPGWCEMNETAETLLDAGLSSQIRALNDGTTTSAALTDASLARIAKDNPRINAWLAVDIDGARAAAAKVDETRKAGNPVGALAGAPVGLKDMICTRGLTTTAASKMLANFVPPYDATVTRHIREASGVIVGKLNQDEFAMGSSNENSAFGSVRNPVDDTRSPGGSSGGSAAAVAANHCALTLGTDTGGSIRQPASFCGVVGVKPTYGRISRWGVVAFASSLDQVGPLTRSVEDAALALDVLMGHDPADSTSLPSAPESTVAALDRGVAGLRIGVPKEYFGEGCTPDVAEAVREALATYEALGATLVEVSLPHTSYAVATYYLVATAEASSNLARYDGMRFGHRSTEASGLADLYAKSRTEGFGPEVKRRIMLGNYALSAGYYDAYYLKAQKVRTLVIQDFAEAFKRCDVIAAPASPVTAIKLGERVSDPLQMYLLDVFTIPASLAGLPCMSLPCARRDQGGLPIGLQLISPALDEAGLIAAGAAYEREVTP